MKTLVEVDIPDGYELSRVVVKKYMPDIIKHAGNRGVWHEQHINGVVYEHNALIIIAAKNREIDALTAEIAQVIAELEALQPAKHPKPNLGDFISPFDGKVDLAKYNEAAELHESEAPAPAPGAAVPDYEKIALTLISQGWCDVKDGTIEFAELVTALACNFTDPRLLTTPLAQGD